MSLESTLESTLANSLFKFESWSLGCFNGEITYNDCEFLINCGSYLKGDQLAFITVCWKDCRFDSNKLAFVVPTASHGYCNCEPICRCNEPVLEIEIRINMVESVGKPP